eukprot:5901378-Amphidinium_carterae.1
MARLVLDGVWYSLHQLVQRVRHDPLERVRALLELVVARERQEFHASARVAAQGWREWAQNAGAGGAGQAQRWLRRLEALGEEEAGDDPIWLGQERPQPGARGFAAIQQQWYEIWQTHPPPEAPRLFRHASLPPITAEQVSLACSTYPRGKAVGGDAWSLRTWALLPLCFHQRLAGMLNALEHQPALIPELATLIVLLGKPGGGSRPIGLLA